MLIGCGDNRAPAGDAGAPVPDAGDPADPADSGLDSGSISPAFPGTTCSAAIMLESGQSYLGSTLSHENLTRATCSSGTNSSPDSYFTFNLGDTPADLVARIWSDENIQPAFDPVVSVRRDCEEPESELACSDADFSERLELLAETGKVHLIVDGTAQYGGSYAGPYALEVAKRSIVGESEVCDVAGDESRCAAGLRCSGGVCAKDSADFACDQAVDLTDDLADGSVVVLAESFAFSADYLEPSCAAESDSGSAETLFRFTLDAPADVTATTDFPDTEFDTVLSIRQAGDPSCAGNEIACNDDIDLDTFNFKSTVIIENLAAGSYNLVVDGSVAHNGTGQFRLSVTTAPP